jgi:hypothetical protein
MKARPCSLASLPLLLALGACSEAIDAGGSPPVAAEVDDPLAVEPEVAVNSLDDLHQRILVKSCAAQPGLCHSGQFEPNLSTPALSYENLVGRPSLERTKKLRVAPGNAKESLLSHKLRNEDVITQMPLGAAPLSEEDIQAIEAWIDGGALRRPGADPAPVLNNPPNEPQFGIFDVAGTRLDPAGPVSVAPGDTLVFRISVEDFETADEDMPYVAVVLQTAEGLAVGIGAAAEPTTGLATYSPGDAPEGKGDTLDFRFEWTVPEMVTLYSEADSSEVPAAGLKLTVIPIYIDGGLDAGGMVAFGFSPDHITVAP